MTTAWPELPYDAWVETRDTVHLWTQVVGKIKLALTPFLNEWWNVASDGRRESAELRPRSVADFEADRDALDLRHQPRRKAS